MNHFSTFLSMFSTSCSLIKPAFFNLPKFFQSPISQNFPHVPFAFHLLLINELSCLPLLWSSLLLVFLLSGSNTLTVGSSLLLNLRERPNGAEMQQCSAGVPWMLWEQEGNTHSYKNRNLHTHAYMHTQAQLQRHNCMNVKYSLRPACTC